MSKSRGSLVAVSTARPGSRVPPHDLDAEAALLGAMLLHRATVGAAAETLTAADFYRPAHAHVFEAILFLFAAGEPSDPITVADQLAREGLLDLVGGREALVELQAETPSIGSAGRYARIVAERARLRRLIGAAGEMAEIGYDGAADVDAAVDRAEAALFAALERKDASTAVPISTAIGEAVARIEKRFEHPGSAMGASCGLHDLDSITGGFKDGSLWIIGARPSMGKSALGLGIAASVAKTGKPVLYFSLEMSHEELSERLLAHEAMVDATRIATGDLGEEHWSKIGKAVPQIQALPLEIDDNANTSLLDIRSKARRLKAKRGALGLIVVDYLQLMTGRGGAENRQVEVSELSRGLKVLARDLECPVVALSQLSRNLENRSDKRPMLADLRESGSLEQDADGVLFVYRDEVYYPEEMATRGIAELIVAKQRNGPTGTAKVAFISNYVRFANMARGSA